MICHFGVKNLKRVYRVYNINNYCCSAIWVRLVFGTNHRKLVLKTIINCTDIHALFGENIIVFRLGSCYFTLFFSLYVCMQKTIYSFKSNGLADIVVII